MNKRSHLKNVSHLGSAKEGSSHWWLQRLTALAIGPMALWFVYSIVSLAGASHAEVVAWMQQPLSTTLLVLLVPALLVHSALGLQVVIEDYVHHEFLKLACLILIRFFYFLLGAAVVIAVLRVAFGG